MAISLFLVVSVPTTQPVQVGWWDRISPNLLTAAIGAFLGIFSFVVGQIIQKMFIEPIQAQRQIVGKIAYALTYWLNAWEQTGLPPERMAAHQEHLNKASEAIRHLAADLRASVTSIPFYGLMEKLPFVVSRRHIKFIGYLLMQWQLRMNSTVISLIVPEIQKLLNTEIKKKAADKDIQDWVEKNIVFLRNP